MEVNPYFYAAWRIFLLFMLGFSFASCYASAEGTRYQLVFRAPGKKKERLLYLGLFICCILFMRLSLFLFPECKECAPHSLDGWKWAVMVIAPFFLGIFAPLLIAIFQENRVRRNVYRFLTGCWTEGSLRAIYEQPSTRPDWSVYDMRQDGHNLWRFAKRITQGKYNEPVYIAMNIPPENVLQKLEQCNLVTKYGYERLPPSEPGHYLPKGGSIVHFYYQAEYVRIWG